uniref:Uncharacterized protein n=1 Tax=Neogobius melanostomus TaxID=47308 RepID=A0A8C6T4U2_9GOBI
MQNVNFCHFSTGLKLLIACLAARGRYAQKLFRDLFVNYTNALRPVDNTDHAINVTLQVTLSQIIDMDERNQILTLYLWVRQVWMDSFLTWSKGDYDGLDSIRIPSRYVWKPDIVLYNSADDEFSSSIETNVVLRSDGQVTWDQPSITKSSCSQCILTYGSWTHNGNQMDLHIELETADLADLVPNVEWQKNVILYGCCSDPYPDISFTLQLKRRASFYIFNLLLPCMMISFLAPLGFYLPADSGEKVSLGVTVLLALTVFQLLVAESMPPSESVPLIGKYYIATMTMVTASTALTIFIMNLHHCGPEARPVPDWGPSPGPEVFKPALPGLRAGGDLHQRESSSREPEGEGRRGCLHGDVASIAASFQEQRAAQALMADWRKVAKVMDRALMWLFFIMVFIMSVLILGKAI